MRQSFPYRDRQCNYQVSLKEVLETDDYAGNGCFVELEMKYTAEFEEKTKSCPCCPQNKNANIDKFIEYMISTKPKNYKLQFEPKRDRSDKFSYLVHYRQLYFLVKT